MNQRSTLYALELEPGEDPDAKWYIGITTDLERRLYEHKDIGGPPPWTRRNEVVDHAVIGEWATSRARDFEDELTGLLMDEYGVQSARGGRYSTPDLNGTPGMDSDNPSIELVDGLRSCGHDELSEFGGRLQKNQANVERSDIPYKYRRPSVKDEREHVDLFVLEETDGRETGAVRDLEDELGDSLSVIDAREAIYRAGLMNLDDALGVLYGWGYE